MPDKKLTPSDIVEWIKGLHTASLNENPDHDTLHMTEDTIHLAVFKAIAEDRCENVRECARLAFGTEMIRFDRYRE